jgi:DNA-binding MarR family transcriptional regulator
MDSTRQKPFREIGLIESLEMENWLKLPMEAMRDVGPAVQTLGGLLKLTNNQTFCPVSAISAKSQLSERTVHRHLDKLAARGFIVNRGREKTRGGVPRRTCTLVVTAKTRNAMKSYGVLPRWACKTLPWSAKAVLSLVMAKLMSLVETIEWADGKADLSMDDPWDSIDALGGEYRFRWSLDALSRLTGIDRKSAIEAKSILGQMQVVHVIKGKRDDDGDDTDSLFPNREFCTRNIPEGEVLSFFFQGGEWRSVTRGVES